MSPDEAVESARLALEDTALAGLPGTATLDFSEFARVALEAAAPHMMGEPLVHSYAAAGFAICGVQTGGAISRHDGYNGPAHRTTADDRLVTCKDCIRKLTP